MVLRNQKIATPRSKAKLIVCGLGNIGSALVPHLARMTSVGEVTLIDFDRYDLRNRTSQEIRPQDVSRPKALVQGRCMRQIDPTLRVNCQVDHLENVPLGEYRADAIVACLDTRSARMRVNEIACRLNVPWIDAAVDAGGWLARVNVYLPGMPEAPCYECAFSDADYAGVEQAYPCQRGRTASAPTNAPSSLGAVAAALQAVECQKLLAGEVGHLLAGRQVMIDLRHHKHFVTRFRRNAACQFDHQTWQIARLSAGPSQMTVGDACDLVASAGPKQIQAPGHSFARRVVCTRCLQSRDLLRISRRLHPRQAACPGCGGEMEPVGFELIDWLEIESLDRRDRRRTLQSLGFRPRDVFAIRGAAKVHYFECGEST